MTRLAEQDRLAYVPLWTPALAAPASASNSAFYYTHTTREACRLIFRHGLWPAALAIWSQGLGGGQAAPYTVREEDARRSEEHTSELQSLMCISYAVFCLKKKN